MRIQATDERHYLVEVFTKFGFNQDDSQLLADTLVDVDLRGISWDSTISMVSSDD